MPMYKCVALFYGITIIIQKTVIFFFANIFFLLFCAVCFGHWFNFISHPVLADKRRFSIIVIKFYYVIRLFSPFMKKASLKLTFFVLFYFPILLVLSERPCSLFPSLLLLLLSLALSLSLSLAESY